MSAELTPAAGAVNAHTHLYSGLVPLGLPALDPPPADFRAILARLWWRLDRALDARTLRAAARYYVARALLAGTTALVDHHESPALIAGSLDVLADACEELGCRAVLCYGVTERNGGRDEARAGLAEGERFLRENHRALVRGAVGVHASFTVSDATLREAGALARARGVPVHVHLAEDRCDVDDALARGYTGPLERLVALDALPEGSVLAHGVHLSAAQVARASERGAWLVQNPRSNENNRVGYPSALRHAPRVALGTDGFPADMAEERAALERIASREGEAAHVADERLRAGRALLSRWFDAADLERDRVLVARDGSAALVREVQVGGRVVVREGELTTGAMDDIEAEARAQAARLWTRMSEVE